MRILSAALILVILLTAISLALPPFKILPAGQQSAILDNETYVNANYLLMFTNNTGNFAFDAGRIFGKYEGLYFPYEGLDAIQNGTANKTVMFDAGLWIGAMDSATANTLVSVAEYSTEFTPGRMVNHTYVPGAETDPTVKVYKLYWDSLESNPNSEYLNWPVAQGAPVDSLGNPDMIVDQMTWCVYNDAKSSLHNNRAGATAPLGVEIQQTTAAVEDVGPLGYCVYLKYKIINKGTKSLKEAYISLWSDPDIGGAFDDLVGCDTVLSLGYTYNGTNTDAVYGSQPPAVGFVLLQGPLQSTGNQSDIGVMWGRNYHGYRNLPMTSFRKLINGTDPSSALESYRYMQGLNRDGTPYTFDGRAVGFVHSGDPVFGTGDIDFTPSDHRMMLTTGPLTLRPNDSTEVVAAIVVGQGSDRLTAVTAMKFYSKYARAAWDQISGKPCCIGSRGDVTGDNLIDISDIQALIDYLFFSEPINSCTDAVDLDASGSVDISDLMILLDYLFFDGQLLPCP